MVHDCVLLLLTTGVVKFFILPGHNVVTRILPALEEHTEHDLHKADEELMDDVFQGTKQAKVSHGAVLLSLFSRHTLSMLVATLMLASGVTAQETEEIHVYANSAGMVPNYANYFGVYFTIFLTVILAVNMDKILKYVTYKAKNMLYKPLPPVKEEDTTEAMDVDEEGDPAMMANPIAALKRKVPDANSANRAAKKKIEEQNADMEEMIGDLHEARTEVVSWKNCAEGCSQQINGALTDSANYKRDLKDLKDEHRELQEKYDKSQVDIENLEEQVRKQRQRGDDLCDQVDDIQGALQHSMNAAAMAARANASKDAKIAELTAALQVASRFDQAVLPKPTRWPS